MSAENSLQFVWRKCNKTIRKLCGTTENERSNCLLSTAVTLLCIPPAIVHNFFLYHRNEKLYRNRITVRYVDGRCLESGISVFKQKNQEKHGNRNSFLEIQNWNGVLHTDSKHIHITWVGNGALAREAWLHQKYCKQLVFFPVDFHCPIFFILRFWLKEMLND